MTEYAKLQNKLRWECREWWRKLNGVDSDGVADRMLADRKSRAELRRIGSRASEAGDALNLASAYAVDRFYRLRDRCAELGVRIHDESIALAAAVLAHVDIDLQDQVETASLLGDGDPPVFAEARFKRLIRTDQPAELLPQLVRAVKILGKAAPVGELGASLLLWGPTVKKRWAFAYWQRKYIPAELPENPEQPTLAA